MKKKAKRKKIPKNYIKNKKTLKVPLKIKLKLYFYLLILIIGLLLGLFVYQFEKEVVPAAIAISQKYVTNIISQEIDKSVEKIVKEMGLYSGKFFDKSLEENKNNFIDVDTILINSVCSNVSNDLSKSLNELNYTKIPLPIGIFSGFNAFSDLGPKFKTTVISIGDAIVDYETNFESVGINQINFQVYLKINTKVSIINPMYKKDIEVSRKLMLVNTVFNGEVPNTYLNVPNVNNK